MATKLLNYLNGLIEAIWLGAIIIIPIFFNVYTSRIFEPDKTVIIRSLALISLAILVVRALEAFIFHFKKGVSPVVIIQEIKAIIRKPLVIPVAGIAFSYILATIFSVSPLTSFWGSYQRLQGTYTNFSYLVIFLSVVFFLRRCNQLERLISVAILASFPVSLYGVIQRYGQDPIPWAGNVIDRVAANMGNSIFVAAFLIMVFPLTVIRITQSIQSVWLNKDKGFLNLFRLALYLLIALLQLMAIYFSGSRGPWLGLGVSVLVLFLGVTYIFRNRSILLIGIGVITLLSVCLVLLNIPGGPFEGFQSIPRLGRLGQLLDLESRTGKVRTLIWEGASELVLPHEPLQFPDGTHDKYNILRPLIGYGPETMFVAFNRFYQPGLTEVEKRNASPDRSHNETWDVLVFTGVTGLLFYYFLIGSILYYTFKWMRLIKNNDQRLLYFLFAAGGSAVSTILLCLWKGISFLGIGLPFGFLVGTLAYFGFQILRRSRQPAEENSGYQTLLLVGFIAAVLANFTELIFGFGISTTKLYFWVYVGVLLVIGERIGVEQFKTEFSVDERIVGYPLDIKNRQQSKSKSQGHKRKPVKRKSAENQKTAVFGDINLPWVKSALGSGLIVTILVITIAFDFLAKREGAGNAWDIIQSSFFPATTNTGEVKYGALVILFASWMISIMVLSVEENDIPFEQKRRGFLLIAAVSMLLSGVYFIFHANQLFVIVKSKPSSLEAILNQVRAFEWIFLLFFIYALTIIFILGWRLTPNLSEAQPSRLVNIYAPAIICVFLVFLIPINMRIIQADVAFKASESFTQPGLWSAAIEIYDRTISLSPNEDYYYLFIVRAFLEQARSTNDPTERDRIMQDAERYLDRAITINPLNTDHTANMARMYISWSSFTEDAVLKRERLAKGIDYYDLALKLSPNNSRLWGELALIYNTELNQPEKSFEILNRALELDPDYDWLNGLSGEFLYNEAEAITTTNGEKEKLYQESLEAYQKSLHQSSSGDKQNRYRITLSTARVLTRLNRIEEAIQYYQDAIKLSPDMPETWRIYEILSSLFLAIDKQNEAIQQARQSLEIAPDDQKPRLEKWLNEISGQP